VPSQLHQAAFEAIQGSPRVLIADFEFVADFVVDNGERAPDDVAAQILGLVGWLR